MQNVSHTRPGELASRFSRFIHTTGEACALFALPGWSAAMIHVDGYTSMIWYDRKGKHSVSVSVLPGSALAIGETGDCRAMASTHNFVFRSLPEIGVTAQHSSIDHYLPHKVP